MEENQIFCSYSARDRELVLKIVKTLQSNGVNAWIDQLGIQLGERWDATIEKALENSDTLLIFVSKASMESSNVMDELSYFLAKGGKIIPVILEDCELPMRLKKHQQVSLIDNYEVGMQTLIKGLLSEESFVEPNVDDNIIIDEGITDENTITDYNVFISYNHGDIKTALKIRDILKKSGIEVTIDQDSMNVGQEIKSFISDSIQNSDAVLTLISNKSLKSGWVGVETFDTMFAESQNGQRKLIGCVLDSDFYNYDYTINTIEGLDEEIKLRKQVLIRQLDRDVSVTDISSEIDRLRNLRQNFPETMKRLRDFKCIDVSDDDIINHSMDKFVNQLKRTQIL